MAQTLNGTVLTEHQILGVSAAEISTSCLSIIGASSIIISSLWKKKVRQPEVHPIFHLSLADLLASLFLLTGCVLYIVDDDRNHYERQCMVVIGLSMTFFLCTFLLTLTYAIEVYIRMKERLNRKPMRESIYGHFPSVYALYVLSWIVPVFCAAFFLIFSLKNYPTIQKLNGTDCQNFECVLLVHHRSKQCAPEVEHRMYLVSKLIFLFPLLVSLTGNLVLYFLTHRALKQMHVSSGVVGPRQYIDAARVRNRAILYCSMFCICWLPSVTLGLVSFTNGFNMQSYYWLYIVQACTTPLQGLLNCIVYGWQRRGFQIAFNIKRQHTQIEKFQSLSVSGDSLLSGYSTFSSI
ncbi:transmembrane protein 116-like [Ptychodera flava]|uniref:transmembrane protein 116-like n=1 Tax=Ptychodera flava TaxID=63121 RepID=UPI00396A792B